MIKKLSGYLLASLYSLARLYWFFRRPVTTGVRVVLSYQGQILLVRHTYIPDFWLFPGGKMKKNESPETAAAREIQEELGLTGLKLKRLGFFISEAQYKQDTIYVLTAESPTKEVIIDDWEIAEARWFALDNLPALGPITGKILKLYYHSFDQKISKNHQSMI